MSAILALVHAEFERAAAVRALDRLHGDGIALRLERGLVLGQVRAQLLESRQIRVAGHFAGLPQPLHVRDRLL